MGGVVSARNAGIEAATGEFIGFVDGDDWIEADMYEYMVNTLESIGADIVDSGYFLEKNGIAINQVKLLLGDYLLDDVTRHKFYQTYEFPDRNNGINSYSLWSKLFRRHIIKKVYRYVPEQIHLSEDSIYIIYCIKFAKRICQIDREFYHYVYRETSAVHQRSFKWMIDSIVGQSFCLELIRDFDIYANEVISEDYLKGILVSAWNSLYNNTAFRLPYYQFPSLEKVLDKKIILYGAGHVGNEYYLQLIKYSSCELIAWVDKNYRNCRNIYKKIESVDIVSKKEFDYIIIGVFEEKIADEIKKDLQKYQISADKILWYKPNTISELI